MKPVHKLETDDVLAKHVFDADGRVLLRAGVKLTPGYIRSLKSMGFVYVYVQDDETYDIVIEETVRAEVQQEVVMKVKHTFDRIAASRHSASVAAVRHSIIRADSSLEGADLDDADFAARDAGDGLLPGLADVGEQFADLFKLLLDELMGDQTFIVNLTAIYSSDAYLYTHSMNVGILAAALGMARGFDERRIRKFGVGAMLHDIGKLLIDPDILNKPGRLSAEERLEIERHCELGYQILRRQPDISILSAHCALQHHEKFDGTGYPRKLKGEEIHEFGRLLAVPDVYDALVTNRVYRRAFLPHEAVAYLVKEAGSHFDPAVVDLFLKHVNIYPNGTPVALSDGTSGVVARANPDNLQRPVVLVLAAAGGKVQPYEVNLAQASDLEIAWVGLSDDE
ncbi:HD-GYP domain-containing protein [Alicyclobacillus cycloheptanicus]|uniref:HD-GYP domain-containing protein (C-di-GMP phosphodiesterase class II) n=1 Tax=Alicyclobacillus cycloheptanicus TaxID=1457 RepID=A0ABT9XLU2_9BACL|nr:HD-GYP domain-containing protein [Alicyclobacillus cycloheptanicus]MDQ0191192.1 HD-GYP domain-containing protein (c-di-GMP phosphodiesterase class II) [Alicyclobacillus cycloheptanicus]WDM02107.1 HD-GYP domain-containing protein [Alicyclobacillus cycloheptanicus]